MKKSNQKSAIYRKLLQFLSYGRRVLVDLKLGFLNFCTLEDYNIVYLKLGRYPSIANTSGLSLLGPSCAYLTINIMLDASRFVHNRSKIPEIFRLNGWFRIYMDSARDRSSAGHVLGLGHI